MEEKIFSTPLITESKRHSALQSGSTINTLTLVSLHSSTVGTIIEDHNQLTGPH